MPTKTVREIAWIKAALKDFDRFPEPVRDRFKYALEAVADGEMPDNAKPLRGFAEGVFEISVPWRTDTWRTIYAVKLGDAIWVLHAFQKKSTHGIKTPQHEIDLTHQRIKRIKEQLR